MGFTPWPSDLSLEGIQTAHDFERAHGDIVSIMIMGGLPWPEAYAGGGYSSDVENMLNTKPGPGQKMFVSISPLNMDRSGLAPYWGEHDNLPLPEDWRDLEFDDPKVEAAFLAFCKTVVERMKPDYLAIGVEDNVLLSKNPSRWAKLKVLHKKTYKALKAIYPILPVFFTTDIGHYRKFAKESQDKPQREEVADLMKSSDFFAMSYYPYMNLKTLEGTEDGFLDFAKQFNKPICVSESGMLSQDVRLPTYGVTLPGSPQDQVRFLNFLLKTAQRDKYEFVVAFATTDFERLTARLSGPIAEVASIWQYCGLQRSDKSPKPALAVWDRFFKQSYAR